MIREYWANKDQNAALAMAHTQECEIRYKEQINEAAKNTVTYSPDHKFEQAARSAKGPQITVIDTDSVSAIIDNQNGKKLAVLNFSSYKNPGGMFIAGSVAQEECLCHESFLFNVLQTQYDFYEWNNRNKNRAMYMNRALYTPNILFMRDSATYPCDVITCAAPNMSAARQYMQVKEKENKIILRNRIKFILDIAGEQKVDTLILGAYGCGVFGQDPYTVATYFKELIRESNRGISSIIFAVPSGNNENLQAFRKVFDGK